MYSFPIGPAKTEIVHCLVFFLLLQTHLTKLNNRDTISKDVRWLPVVSRPHSGHILKEKIRVLKL